MRVRTTVLAAFLLVVSLPAQHAAPVDPAEARLSAEIERLEGQLDRLDSEDLPADVRPGVDIYRKALAKVRTAAPAEYRLYRLRDAYVGVETLAFLAREKSAGSSIEAFGRRWESSRERFEAKVPEARGTLLERGLSDSASTRAQRLFRASRPYAKANAPWSGVYYLGEADANLRFRDFVQSLAAPRTAERTPAAARLGASLDELQQITLDFFGGDVTSPNAIPVSVRLKEARELLDQGRAAGAALLLVEARAALSRRGGPGGRYSAPAPESPSLTAMLEGWSSDEASPMKEALREQVAPFFATLFLPAAPQKKVPASVTVTLVRWPYT